MRRAERVEEAASLMRRFGERTGISGDRTPRRYLWTDSFAIANALVLRDETGDDAFLSMALGLVDQVHSVLGRHRPDDARRGWLSGLAPSEALLHPTCGGLRIGKPLPERAAHEAFDDRREWDRDGQYFHYLTRWMQALDQLARRTGESRFNLWARELADVAHRRFVSRTASGRLAMYWKMSIDLDRPLVASMGQHDPIDGLVTCLQLRATAEQSGDPHVGPDLDHAIADFAALASRQTLVTADVLGIGGLLMDASRVAQLIEEGAFADEGLFLLVLDAACRSLQGLDFDDFMDRPAESRLAFRELGLAIGLAAIEPIERLATARPIASIRLESLDAHLAVLREALGRRDEICDFWCESGHRRGASWVEHCDINDVMLATSLIPEGWVKLASPASVSPSV